MEQSNANTERNTPEQSMYRTRWLTVCGLLMAINTIFSSFSVPVPGGHIYLNDIIIVIAALSLDPLGAFLVGGVGAFLGDFFFYPLPMFVSLATHGVRSVIMALIVRKYGPDHLPAVITAVVLGAVIAVFGYTFGKAYIYSTPEYALMKLPFEIAQAAIGSSIGFLLWKNRHLGTLIHHFIYGK